MLEIGLHGDTKGEKWSESSIKSQMIFHMLKKMPSQQKPKGFSPLEVEDHQNPPIYSIFLHFVIFKFEKNTILKKMMVFFHFITHQELSLVLLVLRSVCSTWGVLCH